MRKRIGTKIYDTDSAELVETRPDGIQVYRKTGRSQEVFLYNPNGKDKYEMFYDLPEEEAKKYLPEVQTGNMVYGSSKTVRFSPDDRNRIMKHAKQNGMSMSKFLLMLVDEYEKNLKA